MRFVRRALTLAVAGAVLAAAPATAAFAEGSRDLYPTNATCATNAANGTCRANIEWRTNLYGPAADTHIARRTLFYVYAQAGEVLEMGSSAVGVDSGDITVYDPGVITDTDAQPLPTVTSGTNGFKCSVQRTASGVAAQGMITSRAQELAGPQAVSGGGNPTGYVPCSYVAPSTGLYNVVFYGPAGDGGNTDGGVAADVNLAAAGDFSAAQGTSVASMGPHGALVGHEHGQHRRALLHLRPRCVHRRQRAAHQPDDLRRHHGRLPLPDGHPRPGPQRLSVLREPHRLPRRGRCHPAEPRHPRDVRRRTDEHPRRRRAPERPAVPAVVPAAEQHDDRSDRDTDGADDADVHLARLQRRHRRQQQHGRRRRQLHLQDQHAGDLRADHLARRHKLRPGPADQPRAAQVRRCRHAHRHLGRERQRRYAVPGRAELSRTRSAAGGGVPRPADRCREQHARRSDHQAAQQPDCLPVRKRFLHNGFLR